MRRGRFVLFPLLIAIAYAVFQYMGSETFVNPETGRSARVALSSDEEAQLGVQSYREVLAQSRVISHGPDYEMVKRVAARLAQVVDAEGVDFDWQVSLIESDQANAFCLPGGKIAVYTGILPHTKTEGGLAAVMGHEMAHAVARHGSQRLLRTTLAQTVMLGAQFSLYDMSMQDRHLVMAALGAGAQFGVLLPFSRSHETEADQMGLLYMARAGYDPGEAIAFWERMHDAGSHRQPEFMSTHPSHETRIRDLQAFLPKAREQMRTAVTRSRD
ncbi:MAG: M48 family metallopeptidase [Opitutaceae bacterium]|nr:M48 family metallopeptidase [Opitutaceae bacterium]